MSFLMLNIAQRALAAQQIALEVTANNMANATTPGYHEEVANLAEAPPVAPGPLGSGSGPGPLGQGVDVASVGRFQNAFLSRAVRNQLGFTNRWQTIHTVLGQVQGLFQEPSAGGLQEALNAFFSAWNQYAQSPYSAAAQDEVYEQGKSLAQAYNSLQSQLGSTAANVETSIGQNLAQLDNLAAQVAAVNRQIAVVAGSGQSPNALEDQVGTLLDQMAGLADIQYTVESNHTVNVYLDGRALVTGDRLPLAPAWRVGQPAPGLLSLVPSPGGAWYSASLSLQWADGTPADIQAGTLGGNLAAWQTLAGYGQNLALLGETLADSSVGGSANPDQVLAANSPNTVPFFSFTAGTLGVAVSSAAAVSAANNNAQNMAALANPLVARYTTLVGQVGVDGQAAQGTADNAQAVLTELKNARSSAVGVDMNQESANLIQEQQSYLAAARVVQAEQSTFQSLLAALG